MKIKHNYLYRGLHAVYEQVCLNYSASVGPGIFPAAFFTLAVTVFSALLVSISIPSSALAAETPAYTDRTELQESGVNNLRSRETRQQQSQISRRQASDLASGRYQGRVLSIRLDKNNWRVRMDRDGTVFNVFVNANSGVVSAPSD